VEAATTVGQRLGASAEEFNTACEHIVRLLTDALMLLESGSAANVAFRAVRGSHLAVDDVALPSIPDDPRGVCTENLIRVADVMESPKPAE
jgi:hypothetical protein